MKRERLPLMASTVPGASPVDPYGKRVIAAVALQRCEIKGMIVARFSAPFFDVESVKTESGAELMRVRPTPARFFEASAQETEEIAQVTLDQGEPLYVTVTNKDSVTRHFHGMLWCETVE